MAAPIKMQDANQSSLEVLMQAHEKASSDYHRLQVRLEKQVQERETALFELSCKQTLLARDHAATLKREQDLKNRVTVLDLQIVEEQRVSESLRNRIKELEAQIHLLRADLETMAKESEDFQGRLTDSENRNATQLEQNIALQREVNAIRRLPELENRFKALKQELNQVILRVAGKVVAKTFGLPLASLGAGFAVASFLVATPVAAVATAFTIACSGTGYSLYKNSTEPRQTPEDLMARQIHKDLDDLRLQILEIRMGISREEFLSKPEKERNKILAQYGLGKNETEPSEKWWSSRAEYEIDRALTRSAFD